MELQIGERVMIAPDSENAVGGVGRIISVGLVVCEVEVETDD